MFCHIPDCDLKDREKIWLKSPWLSNPIFLSFYTILHFFSGQLNYACLMLSYFPPRGKFSNKRLFILFHEEIKCIINRDYFVHKPTLPQQSLDDTKDNSSCVKGHIWVMGCFFSSRRTFFDFKIMVHFI